MLWCHCLCHALLLLQLLVLLKGHVRRAALLFTISLGDGVAAAMAMGAIGLAVTAPQHPSKAITNSSCAMARWSP